MNNHPQLNDAEFKRYNRHVLLDKIGEVGQIKLKSAHILIVGMGGLGCPVATYLVAAGVGHLVIADDDVVSESNLQRQVLYQESQIGLFKSTCARENLLAVNHSAQIRAVNRRLEGQALEMEVMQADVVIDCSDNLATRYQVSDMCLSQRTPLVAGAAIGFDGQLMVFDFRDEQSPCYRCLFPQAQEMTLNCSNAGVVGPLVGMIGSAQALEAIKLICHIDSKAVGCFASFDGITGEWFYLAMQRQVNCSAHS